MRRLLRLLQTISSPIPSSRLHLQQFLHSICKCPSSSHCASAPVPVANLATSRFAKMADSATVAPVKKKLPFKRTVARRKSPDASTNNGVAKHKQEEDDDDDGVDLFRHVNEELPEVLQEQERGIKQREKRSSSSAATKSDPEDQDVKRRKLSMDGEEDEDHNTTPRRSTNKPKVEAPYLFSDDIFVDVKGKGKAIFKPNGSSRRNKPPASFSPTDKKIGLDDDEDVKGAPSPKTPRSGSYGGPRMRAQRRGDPKEEEEMLPNPFANSPLAVKQPDSDDDDSDGLEVMDGPPIEDDEPDDEFQEYIQRARERADREAKLKLERESQAQDNQDAKSAGDRSFGMQDDVKSGTQDPAPADPVVDILVTSVIPGAREKMFNRRLNADLGPVRDAWLTTQNPPVPKELWDWYFLTWRGNRVYSTSSCASLGVRIGRIVDDEDKKGKRFKRAKVDGADYADKGQGAGLHEGGIHLEVWTEELYTDYLKRKERERLRLLGELDDDGKDGGSGSGGEDGEAAAVEEVTTKVIMKADKDYEPLRFKAHGHTTVDQMIATFRHSRGVPDDKEISLFFDGEKLEGDMAVRETDIEDMDSLEVHIK